MSDTDCLSSLQKELNLHHSKNYQPKIPEIKSLMKNHNEDDILEEVLKEQRSPSGSTDLESFDSSDRNNVKSAANSSGNISIILNETNNYFTFNNYQSVPPVQEKQTFFPVSFNTYNDETLIKLSPYLIKEQNGSRFLQKKIMNDYSFTNYSFYPYLLKEFSEKEINELVCDQFGNYLFQALIDSLEEDKLGTLIKIMKPQMYNICINNYGTRVIQKLISVVAHNENLLKMFISIIAPITLKLLSESHGNHIIQKFLEDVKNEKNKHFLNNIIFSNFSKIATHKFGCCTIQKFLSESLPSEKQRNFELIRKNINHIISNQYGSYVFQYIIEKEDEDFKIEILHQILPFLLKICKTKYSSNAIEKCFEFHCKEIQEIIINKICENNNNIKELIMDPYGNYIIQKALLLCDPIHYEQIINVIATNTEKIKKLNFGYKLISKLLISHKLLADKLIKQRKGM